MSEWVVEFCIDICLNADGIKLGMWLKPSRLQVAKH